MDALVTCMYNGLSGTRFGGRLNRDDMYRGSLRTIARAGLPIFCFVPDADIAAHRDYFQASPNDIRWVPLALQDIPHHARIQEIKAADPDRYGQDAWRERCVEIMWGKFTMLERVLDAAPDAASVYWIDAGLANANIISTKYIAEADLAAHRLAEVGAAFPPTLYARMREFAGDRILAIKTSQPHNPGVPAQYNARPYAMPDGVVGGLFGGPRARVAELCRLFAAKAAAILQDNALYFEESILTGIYADHPELFQMFTFDTWYHEGWEAFDASRVNFSQFFDLMLETPAVDRVVKFPWVKAAAPNAAAASPADDTRASPPIPSPAADETNIAYVTLHHMGRTGFRPSLVVIGAMDGISHDELTGSFRRYAWSGLFVEPVPAQFNRLRDNAARLGFGADNRFENSAIADRDGTAQMLTINRRAIEESKVPCHFDGMSALYPPRNGLADAAEIVAAYGEMIEVPCLTLATLFARHAVDRLDVLCIDAEGWDYDILRQLDFATYRPKFIRCEHVNLSSDDRAALVELLRAQDYVVQVQRQDVDAVAAEYWREVTAARSSGAAVASIIRPGNLTLVTAVFDLGTATSARGGRELDAYLADATALLAVDWPMVIFTQPELDALIRRARAGRVTHVFHRSVADLEAFPFYERIRAITAQRRAQPGMRGAAPLDRTLALSKQYFLNDVTIGNPHNTDYFLWVDADVAREIGDPGCQFSPAAHSNLSALLGDDRLLYVGTPLGAAGDAAGVDRSRLGAFTDDALTHVIDGRLFGGTRQAINAIFTGYFAHLDQTIKAGYLESEAEILTLVSHTYRHLCNLQVVPGGLRQFFERLQQRGVDAVDERTPTAAPPADDDRPRSGTA